MHGGSDYLKAVKTPYGMRPSIQLQVQDLEIWASMTGSRF